jgi:hypothetical protein
MPVELALGAHARRPSPVSGCHGKYAQTPIGDPDDDDWEDDDDYDEDSDDDDEDDEPMQLVRTCFSRVARVSRYAPRALRFHCPAH